MNETGPIHFLNLEYFFRLLYDWVLGAKAPTTDIPHYLTQTWLLVTEVSYVLTVLGLALFVYATVCLYRIREEAEHRLHEAEAHVRHTMATSEPSRFEHIMELMKSEKENDWRQAIIEADIMLEEILKSQGYLGETMADKLEQVGHHLGSIEDAWAAHKVRNHIAHAGSSFALSERDARSTIARYESVFRELGVVS